MYIAIHPSVLFRVDISQKPNPMMAFASHTKFFVYKNNVCEMPSSDLAFERVCIRPLFDINSHYIFVHKI
jgi:hypothetical protein